MTKKIKWKSAAEKAAAMEDQASWQALIAKHSKTPFGTNGSKAKKESFPKLEVPRRLDAKSVVTPGGSTSLAAPKEYTGTKMIGIGQLHKSNAVPVFKEDDAKDLASMRR